MKKLFLIPARGGSKGLPHKNILPLAGRPMIEYTLDAALACMEKEDEICVSTDDMEIIQIVERYGVKVPFVRPSAFATDTAGSQQVIEHAVSWYEERGKYFDVVVLLQVTSPLRNVSHIKEALKIWDPDVDMVVSVKETDSNPYYVLFEEDANGYLRNSKYGSFVRRQDCPKVYEYNGAIYVISIPAFKLNGIYSLDKRRKFIMPKKLSIDIDDQVDFMLAEFLMKEQNK